jgi:hypothetical protein
VIGDLHEFHSGARVLVTLVVRHPSP